MTSSTSPPRTAVRGFDVPAFVDKFRGELEENGKSLATNYLADGRIISIVMTAIAGGGWVGIHEDVTAQRAQARLVEEKATELELTNARFTAALRHMSHGLCLFGPDKRVIVANARYAEIYRLNEDQVKPGTALRDILQAREDNGTGFATNMDSYLQVNVKQAAEIQRIADGRMISIKRQPMSNGGWLTTHEDVTAEKQNEKLIAEKAAELEVINTRFSTALSNMAQGLCMFDGEKRLTVWNDRYVELLGMPEHLLKVGTPLREILTDRVSRGMLKKLDDARRSGAGRRAARAAARRNACRRVAERKIRDADAPADGRRRLGHADRGHHRAAPRRGRDRASGAA